MVLPQGVYFNALCYLTEQIHQVATPYQNLDELLKDVEKLGCSIETRTAPYSSDPNDHVPTSTPAAPVRSGRKPNAKRTPAKRASTSPATSRILRNTPSRQNQVGGTGDSDSDRRAQVDAGRHAARSLASRLKQNIQVDVDNMRVDRSEALLTTVEDFKDLQGVLDNVCWISYCLMSSAEDIRHSPIVNLSWIGPPLWQSGFVECCSVCAACRTRTWRL